MLYVEECLEVLSMECPTWKKEQDDAMRKSDAFPLFHYFCPKTGSGREKRSSAHEDTFTAVRPIIIYLLTQHCFLAELVIVYFEAS